MAKFLFSNCRITNYSITIFVLPLQKPKYRLTMKMRPTAVRLRKAEYPSQPIKAMMTVSNVSMRYGAKVLFEEVSTAFTPGKRYGLTGPDGAGKTTFMNLPSGELEPQKGNVMLRES